MQLIIVDDEAHWADNLSMHKPWHTLGIDQVHKAYSAREALELIEMYPIDIVISDILMPEMTGIELIEKIRERDKRIKCIILSGHSDFEYAKEAIKHQALQYLLKPPTDEELFAAVGSAIEQLKTEWESVSSYERTQFALRENLPLLRSRLLLDALRGERLSEEEWHRKLDTYSLPYRFGDCTLMLVRMEEEFDPYRHNGQHLMEYAVMNIAEEIFGEYAEAWSVKEEHGYLAFLLQFKPHQSGVGKDKQLDKLAMQLQTKVKQFLKGSLSIVITEPFQFPEQLPAVYHQAASSFRQFVGEEREFVMRVCEREQRTSRGTLGAIHAPPGLKQLLEAGRFESVEEKLHTIFAELEADWSESWEHCMEAGFLIASSFTHFAHRSGHTLGELLGKDMEPLQSGEAFTTIGKLRNWSLIVMEKLKAGAEHDMNDVRSQYVKKIQAYAEKNLHEDVSLRALADHVNLHTTHLSKIYKLETGEGISDYIARLRMDRASFMLKHTDKKVYEISANIGYLDPAYFIKVFKKQFGLTPQEYREHGATT